MSYLIKKAFLFLNILHNLCRLPDYSIYIAFLSVSLNLDNNCVPLLIINFKKLSSERKTDFSL